MLQGVDVEKLVEEVEAHAAARRAVDGQRHIESLGRLVDGVEIDVAIALVQARDRGQQAGNQSHRLRPLKFFGGFQRLMHRQQGYSLEAGALLDKAIDDPRIVSAREHARPLWVLYQPQSQPARRVKYGTVDPKLVEKL